jgi:asparagine N-glycosylation enzyme membrane subunit Stt3
LHNIQTAVVGELWKMLDFILKNFRKLVVAIIGFTVLFIGLLMIVLPGPAIIFIPLGLGILAIEFIWARKILRKIKDKMPFHDKSREKDEGKNRADGP